jgi:hypothetical protein
LQEGSDAVPHPGIAGNNMSARMPKDQGILEESCKMIGTAARDHEIRLADDVN